MVSDGGRSGNAAREREHSTPVLSEAIRQWPSSTAGTETKARVDTGDEDEPEVTSVSFPWAGIGHSAKTVTVAAGMLNHPGFFCVGLSDEGSRKGQWVV